MREQAARQLINKMAALQTSSSRKIMNRIFPEQLASNLNSHLAKVYFLVGTDPLLLSESEDLIHQAALLQGFDEKKSNHHRY